MRGVVIATTLLMVSVAAADAPTARVEVSGACALDTVTNRTNELLGRTALTPEARAAFSVTAEVESDAVVATLEYVDDAGGAQQARTISATSCDELAESVAVVVSLLLRQEALSPPPRPRVRAELPVDPVREVESGVARPIGPARTRSIDLGGAGGTTGAASFMVGGRLQRCRAAAAIELGLETPVELPVGSGSVHVAIGRLNASSCVRLGSLNLCGLLTGGVVRGRGEGLMDARTAIKPIAGLGVRLEWRQLVSTHVGMRLFGDFEQLLANTRFLVDGMSVWTSDSRQAWFGVGVFLQGP